MVRKELSPKKSCSLLICRMDLFCLQGLISCELSVTAWAWVQGSKAASEQGQGKRWCWACQPGMAPQVFNT